MGLLQEQVKVLEEGLESWKACLDVDALLANISYSTAAMDIIYSTSVLLLDMIARSHLRTTSRQLIRAIRNASTILITTSQ